MFKESIQTPRIERSESDGASRFGALDKKPEKELIDALQEYVPSVGATWHPEVAQRLVHEVEMATREFSQEIESASVSGGLMQKAEELKSRIWNLFKQPDPQFRHALVDREREEWSITKEFLQAIKTFNVQIKKAELMTGVSLGEYKEYYFRQIKEAEEISSGRLLTHGAPTDVMYQILERGDICSITEQKKRYNEVARTHELAPVTIIPTETHDICFDVDRVYGNLATSIGQFKADVILIFSENHILDRRQYVDLDGRHIFDEHYTGDTEESPGLRIDLLKTPFMILVSVCV